MVLLSLLLGLLICTRCLLLPGRVGTAWPCFRGRMPLHSRLLRSMACLTGIGWAGERWCTIIITNPFAVTVGQRLRIPCGGTFPTCYVGCPARWLRAEPWTSPLPFAGNALAAAAQPRTAASSSPACFQQLVSSHPMRSRCFWAASLT